MILQLNPPIPLQTPHGPGYANFLVDRGMEFDNEWIVFLQNGEIWSFLNRDVRLENNITYSRKNDDPKIALENHNFPISMKCTQYSKEKIPMKKFWISWYHNPNSHFTLHFPWWVSGYSSYSGGSETICAAIKAFDEDHCKKQIKNCYDIKNNDLHFRFFEEKEDDWSPFCERFQKEDWMEF